MGRKYGICQKTENSNNDIKGNGCEQDVSDIKPVKISYAKCIYETD